MHFIDTRVSNIHAFTHHLLYEPRPQWKLSTIVWQTWWCIRNMRRSNIRFLSGTTTHINYIIWWVVQVEFKLRSHNSSSSKLRKTLRLLKFLFFITKRKLKHIIIRLTHTNVWESMGKPCSCMQFIKSRIFYCKSRENPYQYYKSRENPYQVLQVMCAASERAIKSKVRMIKSLSP